MSIDPSWEARYSANPSYRNQYPWSAVVSFVQRNRPRDRPNQEIRILEVGCGNGANIWFAARKGFSVAGVDGSATAVKYAQEWFDREGLIGDIRIGDFSSLPFHDKSFDLVVDRSALTFAPPPEIRRAVGEIWRVLADDGCFCFNPLSDKCTSFDRLPDADGCSRRIYGGTIRSGSQATFFGIRDIRELFRSGWKLNRMSHIEDIDYCSPIRVNHSEWFVEAVKVGRLSGNSVESI
jgi:SAM-dependent methyltransferase